MLASDELVVGMQLEALYGDYFFPAQVVSVHWGKHGVRVAQVQYVGYSESHNTRLPLSCLRKEDEKLSNSHTFQQGKQSLPSEEASTAPCAFSVAEVQEPVQSATEEPIDVQLAQCLDSPDLSIVMEELRGCIAQRLPITCGESISLYVFGSALTGFGNETSDINVAVEVKAGGGIVQSRKARKAVTETLQTLKICFTHAASPFQVQQLIAGAKITTLKLLHKTSKRDLDLSVNNLTPLANTYLLRAYSSLDDRIRAFGKEVKRWAKDLSMCNTSSGWLSSYDLVLMALYFLQVCKGIPSLQAKNPGQDWSRGDDLCAIMHLQPLSALVESNDVWLHEFFAFYADNFHWGDEVVSIRLGLRASRSDLVFSKLSRARVSLDIEDPFLLHRNLAKHLQTSAKLQCFRQAIQKMSKPDEGRDLNGQIHSIVPTRMSGLATALKPEALDTKRRHTPRSNRPKILPDRMLVPLETKTNWVAGERLCVIGESDSRESWVCKLPVGRNKSCKCSFAKNWEGQVWQWADA